MLSQFTLTTSRTARTVAIVALAFFASGCANDEITAPTTTLSESAQAALAEVDLSEVEWVDKTAEAEVTVQSRDNTFLPGYIIVKAGTPITFRNVGRTEHNALPVDEISFVGIEAADFEPKDEHTIVIDTPGEYPYYCSLHGTVSKGMVGAIRVVE